MTRVDIGVLSNWLFYSSAMRRTIALLPSMDMGPLPQHLAAPDAYGGGLGRWPHEMTRSIPNLGMFPSFEQF